MTKESDDVRSLVLSCADGAELPAALPGQHIVIRIDVGPDDAARSYSIIDSSAGRYEIAVKREFHGIMSAYIHSNLKISDVVKVSAPRGSFLVAGRALPIVFISAGIGLTPLLSMLKNARVDPERTVFWFHGARDRAHHPFEARVRRFLRDVRHGHSFIAYTRPEPDLRLGVDYDLAGRLDVDVLRRQGTPLLADFYICGPENFMDSIIKGLRDWGVDQSRIHSEAFGSVTPSTPGNVAIRPSPPSVVGKGPAVTFTRSSLTVRWDPSYGSLLELAEACSVPVRWSCRSGVCHICITGFIDGSIEYSPEPIDSPRDGRVLICCATPTSDIALEL